MKWKSAFQLTDGTRYAPTESKIFVLTKLEKSANGIGLYAEENLLSGTVIAQDGGTVINSIQDVPKECYGYQVLIGDKIWLTPNDCDNKDDLSYLNHSCEPNVARIGLLTYVAKTDISKGTELTIDYATLISSHTEWCMECKCGTKSCRKVIRAKDWTDPKLAKELWREWLPHIQREIKARRIF